MSYAGIIYTRTPSSAPSNPKEVAALVAFLVSDEAGAITGGCLPVDLGWTAR